MEKGTKRLEFYGGVWMSFLPFIVFLALIVLTTFHWASISDGALWVPAFSALAIPFFFAKSKREYADAVIEGMASKEAIIPVVCWIFAGVFSRILRMSGLASGVAGVAAGLGVNSTLFAIVTFIASAVFATASGTGFGTIAAGMGVLYPAGIALGGNPGLLAGAIISGAAFGDNLAPVSDTTICSATSQGVDVPGVVRSRLKYALVAGAITVVAILIYGTMTAGEAGTVDSYAYDPKTLMMFIPVVITIYIAIKTGDIIIATTIGSLVGIVTACAFGLFDFVQIDAVDPSVPAVISVHGEGLDRTVDGVIYTGIASMLQVCILALLLFGSISIMRKGQGDIQLLNALGKVAKTPFSAEITISLMVIVLSALMGLNAPAILAVGASFAKPLAKQHGISPYRAANLMDAQSNTLCYCLPWTPAMIYTLGFAADSSAPLTAVQIMPFVFYSFAMLGVMFLSMVFGIGRYDFMDRVKEEKAA
ncbi:Na+/H+ antiporter NhaC family protein [Sinanaerobacter sp. ZZT-01]|uniref:Na+/H+ antiporter NhaC family protein n=1 Tax=Sinanaerobacter sp. ZZT-01 TaxID=3111540 RepID=UPI002D778878|nr:Na+/H+ antiporter NhaC family protein [Sinanaerobacter sp. ZZT-01]WRR94913.1 Na+/H+ antiporter NhaC family protein [Sinanaerobacter sp. ZZT-01]